MPSRPRAKFLAALILCGSLAPAVARADRSDDPRPNIILILADDLGYGQLGSYGQALIQTPELDQLAGQGMQFTRMYAGTALCLVSRQSLMTGLHVGHGRVRNNGSGSGDHEPITEAETCVSTVLRAAGYRTAMMGKWALGDEFIGNTVSSKNLDGSGAVYKHGWDFYLGEPNQSYNVDYTPAHWYRYDPAGLLGGLGAATPAGELVVHPMSDDPATTDFVESYGPDLCTKTALDFIDAAKDRPFFLYLPYQTIHENLEVPALEPYTTSQPWSGTAKTLASMITRLDRDVGRILDRLATHGIDDDTLVIFTSDNGATATEDALFHNNAPWSGFKATLTDGGLRVPCLARWPGKIATGGTSDRLLAFWDFMPTLCALAGIKSPEPVDGISFVPTLLGRPGQQSHNYLFFTLNTASVYHVVRGLGETRTNSEIFDAAWLNEVIVPTFDPQFTPSAPTELYGPGDPLPEVPGRAVPLDATGRHFDWSLPDGVMGRPFVSEDLDGWSEAAGWLSFAGMTTPPGGGAAHLFAVLEPAPPRLFASFAYEAFAEPAVVADGGGVPDTTPPTGTGSTTVTEGGSPFLSFDEAVRKGTGNIVIRLAADDSVVETIDVTSGAVVVGGSGATITPATALVTGTSYYVEIPPGAFEDLAGNPFAGFSGSSAWSFTVSEAPLFLAYHDFGATTGQESTGFITTHQSGSAATSKNPLDTSPKALVNYADGSATGVSLSIDQANGMDSRDAGECAPPTAGSPADTLFSVAGLNLDNGLVFVGNSGGAGNFTNLTITLTGLNPGLVYDLALYGNRASTADGVERFTLGGADTATNSSSTGVFDAFTTDMNTRPNPGEIARWTGIDPGADGTITVLVDPGITSSTNIAYLSALRLEASSSGSGTDIQSDYWYQSSVTTDGGGPLDLLAELNYNDGRANAPIAVVMHGYSPATGNLGNVRAPAQRLRDNGFFAISVAMRGRDGSDGTRDSGGVEIHDIYDAVEAVKNDPQFAGLIDPANVHITGYSGGGGNVMSALTKFPDYFRLGSSFFGMSDYGFDLADGWYNNGAGSRTSQLDIDIGNPNTGGNPVLDRYLARASNLASKNNPHSEIHLFVNADETICPPWNDTSYRDNAVAAEATPGEFDNITVHIGGTGAYEDFNGNSVNDPNELQSWPHGVPDANKQDAGELWYRDRLLSGAIPQPVLADADVLQVAGFVKTGKFNLWLGDGQNAAGALSYSLSDAQMTFTLSILSNDQGVSGMLDVNTARMSGETVTVKLNGTQVDSFSGGGAYHYGILGHNDTLVLMSGTDSTGPTLAGTDPADSATGVAVDSDLVATFSEPVQKGTGTITIHKSDDTLVETIDVATGAVTVSGAQVTINPAADLDPATGYYVLVASTAIKDASDNFFAGVSDKTTWEFTTASAPASTWVAYHDFGAYTGEESTGFITTHQSGTAPVALDLNPKVLIDYADGSATGVIFSVNQGNGMDPRNAGETAPPATGTPADPLFNIPGLNLNNGLFYVGNNTGAGRYSNQTITLTGLDPGLIYDLALYGHRNAATDGVERFTLGGADAATNSSSTGIVGTFVTDMETRPNQTTGDVVRWTGIDPGADGTITVLVDPSVTSATNISYLSAMRIEASEAGT